MKQIIEGLVSIIIPTYSRPDNLGRAIKSVFRQSYQNVEIIVVDDNGKDTVFQKETELTIQEYLESGKLIYIVHEENKNGSAARNTGLKVSNGEFVNFLDDDDEFIEDKIATQVSLLKANPAFDACCCNSFIQYQHHKDLVGCSKNGNLVEDVLGGKADFNTSTVLFRKNVLEELGGFDETFRRHQDWELYLRFFRSHLMLSVPDKVLLIKHVTTTTAITSNPVKQIDYLEYFLNTYQADFQQYKTKNEIYQHLYLNLANSLLYYSQFKIGSKYLVKAYSYKRPSAKSLTNNLFVFLKSFFRHWL